jgi:hypothetical protein
MVFLSGENGGAEGMIDDAGNYRIEKAPEGQVAAAAYVEASPYRVRMSARKEFEVAAGQSLRVDLDLGGQLRVSGRVTLDGKPVPAEVRFAGENGMMAASRTREDGMYEVLLTTPGLHHISASAKELGDRYFQTLRDLRGGETIDMDLREQVIEGTVVDAATRQPVAGALVTLAPAGVSSALAEMQTDPNGRFTITTTSAGPQRLIVTAHGYAQRSQAVSGSGAPYAFELTPAPELRVRVVDARTGTPLEASVVFNDEKGFVPVSPRRGEDGATFIFSLAPGKYRAFVNVEGFAMKTVEITAPGAVDIVLE